MLNPINYYICKVCGRFKYMCLCARGECDEI